MAIIRHTPTDFMVRCGASSYTITSTGYDPCPKCGTLEFAHPQGTSRRGWCPACNEYVPVQNWRQGADEEAKRAWHHWTPPPYQDEGWGQHRTYRSSHDLFELELKVTNRDVGSITRFRVREGVDNVAGIPIGGAAGPMLEPLASKAAEMWANVLRRTITEQGWDADVEHSNNVVLFAATCDSDSTALRLTKALFKAWTDCYP